MPFLTNLVYFGVFVFHVSTSCRIGVDKDGYKKACCQNERLLSVPQNLPSDIQKLDLSENNLTCIEGYEFSRYKNLKELYISDNQIEILNVTGFYGLKSLKRLSLSRNKLHISKAYPSGVFKSISNLEMLDIRRNMGSDISETVYKIPLYELTHLTELSVDLVNQPSFGGAFRELNSLKKIKFDFCIIKSISNETFLNMPENILEFDLTTCRHFVNIQTNALIHFPYLRTLNLTGSNIHLIQALTIIHPFRNKKMDGLLFRGITHQGTPYDSDVVIKPHMLDTILSICVKTLDLTENDIVKIQAKNVHSFPYSKCFENILLSANRFAGDDLVSFFLNIIPKMVNLKMLDYSYIPLSFKNPVFLNVDVNKKNGSIVERGSTFGKPSLFPSVVFPNSLEYIRCTHLMASNGLEEIIIENSSMVHLDISYFDLTVFPRFTLHGNNILKYLDLSGIDSAITVTKFPTLYHLRCLKMRQANLQNLIFKTGSIFYWAPNLKILDISQNYLYHIKSKTLESLNFLTHLNLSNNNFQSVPEFLTMFKHMIDLDLSYNHITTVKKPIRNWIDKQLSKSGRFNLELDQNSFLCSCSTRDFLLWISFDDSSATKANLDSNRNYSCWISEKSVTNFTQNVIKDFHHYFVGCNNKVWLKTGISLLVLVINVVFLVAIIYNFRWRIVFFFYRKFRKIAERGLDVVYDYDVYVSYTDDNIQFIKDLSRKVEYEWGFKLCLKDRDFPVGVTTSDVIASAIRRSRHAIFILTNTFNEDEWRCFEIERVKYERYSKNLQEIVVITMDCETDNIPIEFATIWKDVFSFEWPNKNEYDLKIMWQRLKRTLFFK